MGQTQIIPTSFEIARNEDGETIKLDFRDDHANSVAILIGQTNLPLLISELQKRALKPVTQMRPEDLALGAQLVLRGANVRAGHDGGVVLTLSVEMDRDHGVDLPMHLSEQDRDGLVTQLMAFARKS